MPIVALAVLLATEAAGAPYVFGWREHLAPEDVAAITEMFADHGSPLAIRLDNSRTLPERWSSLVFLPPAVSTPRLRRGRVITLECAPRPGAIACLQWNLTTDDRSYAQVAVQGAAFGDTLAPRSKLERPFVVRGELSDDHLLRLVDYIRTSPQLPFPEIGQVSGDIVPIIELEVEDNVVVRVWLSSGGSMGESARFRRKGRQWHLLDVVFGVS